jgi:hypothetical protein
MQYSLFNRKYEARGLMIFFSHGRAVSERVLSADLGLEVYKLSQARIK